MDKPSKMQHLNMKHKHASVANSGSQLDALMSQIIAPRHPCLYPLCTRPQIAAALSFHQTPHGHP